VTHRRSLLKPPELKIDAVFSTDLYTGTGSNTNIQNGLDLATYSGQVMIRKRSYISGELAGLNWAYPNTPPPDNPYISWWQNSDAGFDTQPINVGTFNSDGFTVTLNDPSVNQSGQTYVANSFRKADDFYYDTFIFSNSADFVENFATTGGISEIGMIIAFKGGVDGSFIWHRSATGFNITTPTNQTQGQTDISAALTVAGTTVTCPFSYWGFGSIYFYVFGHNPELSFFGSYTGNGSSTGPVIDLGWQPQYLKIKRKTGGSGDWLDYDNVRDTSNPRTTKTRLNQRQADDTSGEGVDFITSGFQPKSTSSDINASGSEYIFHAVRAEST
jgi:hypothetical protein